MGVKIITVNSSVEGGAPSGTLDITQNGEYNISAYEKVDVSVEGGGGSSWTTIFDGEVTTTEAEEEGAPPFGVIDAYISADTIKVTFNGTVYECAKQMQVIDVNPFYYYGGTPDNWSEYPFSIYNDGRDWLIATESIGTYTLKIEEPQQSGSSDFSTAQVTVNGEDEVEVPKVVNEGDAWLSPSTVGFGDTATVALYKGTALATYYGSGAVSVSGSAEADGQVIYITGDCTITIS